jgi:type I restriction enzyme, S subunit
MIDGLKPYPEYKNSGLPWLDKLPAHWEMIPNRALMNEQRKVVGEDSADYKLLSLTLTGIIPRNMETPKGKFPARFNNYKVVRSGDLVFCLFDIDETPRAVGLSKLDGMITGAYDIFTPKPCADARYLYHYYLHIDDGKQLKPLYTGLRKTIQRGVFASLKAPLPPADEQAAIVQFLDHANGRIERTIRAKKKLIALLNEQKQAIIHRTVTRGLDYTVPLKPSGIPWLGDIPKHWELRPLKQLLLRMDYGTSESGQGKGTIRVLTMGHIRDGRVLMPERCDLESVPPGLLLEKNDLLFNRTNSPDLVGKVGLFAGEASDQVTFASYLVRLRVRPEYNPHWLNFLLNSAPFWAYARSQALVSLHQANLNSSRYGRMAVPVPPKAEQMGIVAHILRETKMVEYASARAEQEIGLLREYRTRLTADVVTGKLDVREAARKLPDTAEEAGAALEIEELTDAEPEDAEPEDAEPEDVEA